MPKIKIELEDFLRSFVFDSHLIKVVNSGDTIVYCGLAFNFFNFVEKAEDLGDVVYFVDNVSSVEDSERSALIIYVSEEKK